MTELLLINSNMTFPSDSAISGRSVQIRDIEKVVNLGLLSIASYMKEAGVSVKIIDLVGRRDDTETLRKEIEQEKPRFVGISCISCYTYPKMAQYSELIKAFDKTIFVMAGGQHISGIPQIAMRENPHLDCVVRGEGEYVCRQIITCLKKGESPKEVPSIVFRDGDEIVDNTGNPGEKVNLDSLPFLKYDLYPNFREYSPHVEISRWCVFACNFCTSCAMSKGISYKSTARFVDEVAYVKSLYGNDRDDLKFFFACSTFGVKRKEVEELIRVMKEKNVKIRWRTETRADSPVIDYLEELTEVGLSVLDLGLESASPAMLIRMNKCKNTEEYLSKAREFVTKAGKVRNLLLKINLVFYAGENPDTVRETVAFLFEHAGNIDSMSAGTVVLYAGTQLEKTFSDYREKYGTSLATNKFWDRVHAFPVNPSAHFTFDQLNELALVLSKIFCRDKEYFEVKSYGQFPLGMNFDDFREEADKLEKHHFPFNTAGSDDGGEMRRTEEVLSENIFGEIGRKVYPN